VEDVNIDAEEVAEACIRCAKGTDEGTMGFFVCGFVRDATMGREELREEVEKPGKKQKKAKSRVKETTNGGTKSKTNNHEGKTEQDDVDGDDDWEGFSD